MNLTEHGDFLREQFPGAYIGEVIDIEDPKHLGRVRVRVDGVYDSPIRAEDIPWATPAAPARRPAIGELVPVVFIGGSHYRPVFM
jgi:hypothetical protein